MHGSSATPAEPGLADGLLRVRDRPRRGSGGSAQSSTTPPSTASPLKALIVGAPEELRAELRGLGTKRQIARCAGLRERPTRSLEHRMTARALRSPAQLFKLLA